MPAPVQRISRWQWPQSFPLAQFPNPPLIIALLAAGAGRLTSGWVHSACGGVFYVALTVWAYEEARSGENWFRRMLGAGALIYIASRIAQDLPG